jgi:hypothetical protein
MLKFDWNFFQTHFDSRRLFIFLAFSESLPPHVKKRLYTATVVHIFEPGVDMLQKNNHLFKPPSA